MSGKNHYHSKERIQFMSLAYNQFEGISVIGKETSDKANFLIKITSVINSDSEISVQLIAELSPCHPEYVYNDSDAVSSSSSISAIRSGNQFGAVDGQSTVAVCPKNCCNFICCETASRFLPTLTGEIKSV